MAGMPLYFLLYPCTSSMLSPFFGAEDELRGVAFNGLVRDEHDADGHHRGERSRAGLLASKRDGDGDRAPSAPHTPTNADPALHGTTPDLRPPRGSGVGKPSRSFEQLLAKPVLPPPSWGSGLSSALFNDNPSNAIMNTKNDHQTGVRPHARTLRTPPTAGINAKMRPSSSTRQPARRQALCVQTDPAVINFSVVHRCLDFLKRDSGRGEPIATKHVQQCGTARVGHLLLR
ncbi:hypothetical protein C8J57DRAFT_1480408 [Mycena rebaudengoi]|nr:hypothetical protein C8J57DRAFT_1480408 [Mycena rebaudengoi]